MKKYLHDCSVHVLISIGRIVAITITSCGVACHRKGRRGRCMTLQLRRPRSRIMRTSLARKRGGWYDILAVSMVSLWVIQVGRCTVPGVGIDVWYSRILWDRGPRGGRSAYGVCHILTKPWHIARTPNRRRPIRKTCQNGPEVSMSGLWIPGTWLPILFFSDRNVFALALKPSIAASLACAFGLIIKGNTLIDTTIWTRSFTGGRYIPSLSEHDIEHTQWVFFLSVTDGEMFHVATGPE